MLGLKKYDILNGNITFQQYIDVREALQKYSQDNNLANLYDGIVKALNKGYEIKDYASIELMQYVEDVITDVLHWVKIENETLHYSPTQTEKNAGFEKYAQEVGWMGIVVSLAKEFATRPEVILERWYWKEVYMVLYTDNKKYQYEEKLQKQIKLRYR